MARVLRALPALLALASVLAVAAFARPGRPVARGSFAVGLRTLHLVDPRRTIRLRDGRTLPRRLTTFVRYPAVGAPSSRVRPDAAPARSHGPFPLVVFGHGYAVTPALYARLLHAWAAAGYVVAAPLFPLENAGAPGGPDEADLVNQPADMRFVISRLLAAAAAKGPLHHLIDPARVAVAGQSDGGETAFAVAYDPRFRDARVRAAVVLSGAQLPGPAFRFRRPSPPLLAVQGTADRINPPRLTNAFYTRAPRPKFLLRLLGAGHLGPYSDQEPQLRIVERVTLAFLGHYLEQRPLSRLLDAGRAPGVAGLAAQP